jgi:hypothetical protein
MRRLSTLVSILLVTVFGVVALGRGVTAQEATPAETAQHPFVGTWLLDPDTEDPENPPELDVVTADGAWVGIEATGAVQVGRWEPTGAQTANLTIWGLGSEAEAGAGIIFVVRASIEVAADGQSWTGTYTLELITADGTSVSNGEYGPGSAMATRLSVEPMGTPAGSFEDLFAQFEATPEASPAP